MNTPSRMYERALARATEHHLTTKTYSGKFLRPHAPIIKALIDHVGAGSVLDYGCGKGAQYEWVSHGDDASIPKDMTIEQFWGVPVCKYDPAYPPLAAEAPEQFSRRCMQGRPFDITIVTHVLGSIPVGDLVGWVLPRIAGLTGKAVYVAEKIGEVGKQVFEEDDVAGLARWAAPYWRGFIQGASIAHPHIDWILATHERLPEGQKVMTIRHYSKGEEHKPVWRYPRGEQ